MLKVVLAVILFFILAACDTAPQPDVNAAATLAYAQARATTASRSATATVDASQATLASKSNFATQQASDSVSATKSANDAAINAALLEQARTSTAADAQKKVAEASGAWLQVTQQAQAITATQVAIQATAVKIAKDTANQQTITDANAYIDIASSIVIKIGVPVLVCLSVLVALYKFQQKESVVQPYADGPAFEIKRNLLRGPEPFVIWNPFEEKARYALPAPKSQEESSGDTSPATPQIRDAEIALMYDVQKWVNASINYERYLPQLNTLHNDRHNHGWNGRQLLTARECIAAGIFSRNGGKGEPGGRDAAVKWLQEKHLAYTGEGNSSMQTFDTLGAVSLAIAQALAPYSPAAQVIDQNNPLGTPGEQGTAGNTREQPGTAGNSAGNGGNTSKAVPTDPIALQGAVSSLPDWGGQYVPPKPPAPKPKASLLRRVVDAAK